MEYMEIIRLLSTPIEFNEASNVISLFCWNSYTLRRENSLSDQYYTFQWIMGSWFDSQWRGLNIM